MSKRKIICFGPGPSFKGGISNYNTSLAKSFAQDSENEVTIISWTQQYPAIVPREFVDKKSKVDLLEGVPVAIEYITNYNRPSSWKETAKRIIEINPDKIIFQWYNAQQGLPLGKIVKRIKKHIETDIIFDLHFVIQKEKSWIDTFFIKKGLDHVDLFITHSSMTTSELVKFYPNRKFTISNKLIDYRAKNQVLQLYHPIYDIFEPNPEFDPDRLKKELGLRQHVFLFFGFIRKYKGLHQAIEAFAKMSESREDVSLLICGESFWNTLTKNTFGNRLKKFLFAIVKKLFMKKKDDEKDYKPLELIQKFGIQDKVVLVNDFIANEEVHKYFQVADALVLFYERSSPSGVESIAYNFNLPILTTDVGHFPETIEDGINGYMAVNKDIKSMAATLTKLIEHPIDRNNVSLKAQHMSWTNYVKAILS